MRKYISILLLLLTVCMPAAAQSMTDTQLLQYLRKEKEKGTPEQNIVRNVMQRGVTVEQLRRVRKKVEAEKNQLGAIESQPEPTNPRVRTQRQTADDERQKNNSYMIRSQREQDEFRYLDRDTRMDMLGNELDFMDYDSLQYYYDQTQREQQDYIAYIDEQYNSERLTNILTTLTDMIGATVLNIAKQDYDPQGASVMLLVAEEAALESGEISRERLDASVRRILIWKI